MKYYHAPLSYALEQSHIVELRHGAQKHQRWEAVSAQSDEPHLQHCWSLTHTGRVGDFHASCQLQFGNTVGYCVDQREDHFELLSECFVHPFKLEH